MKESLDPTDPLATIEERLRAMAPADLPPELMTRLADADPVERKVVSFPWRWVSLAAAACVAIAAWYAGRPVHLPGKPELAADSFIAPESVRIYAPVSERNLLLQATEVGVIAQGNSPPVRLVRCLWLDDSTYQSEDGAPDLLVTRAREQIIPVALEVY